jgi:hypothetical protein
MHITMGEKMQAVLRSILGILIAIICCSCGPQIPPSGLNIGQPNKDDWAVFGKITKGGYANGQIVAIGMDGNSYVSGIAQNQSFQIELPGNATYAIYFIPASNYQEQEASEFVNSVVGTTNTSEAPALLCFEESKEIGIRNTLRLPQIISNAYLDLGEIDVKQNHAFPTKNPALALDFDNDGINDFTDLDDQNDGLSDKQQKDLLERVDICHLNPEGSKTENVPLEALYGHIKHGDNFGPCVKILPTKQPDNSIAKEDDNNNDETYAPEEHKNINTFIPPAAERSSSGSNAVEILPEEEGEPNASNANRGNGNDNQNNSEKDNSKSDEQGSDKENNKSNDKKRKKRPLDN